MATTSYGSGYDNLRTSITSPAEDAKLRQQDTGYRSWSNNSSHILLEDLEQSHHFTIAIDKIKVASFYQYPREDFCSYFLPLRSASYTVASVENMSIPLGVFGNFPLVHRQNFGRLTMSIYDNDRESIERQIRAWIASCFPGDTYVNYLSNVVGTLTYKSYSVTGVLNEAVSGTYYVIPADTMSFSRSYEDNGAKVIDFSVVIVGKG